MAPASLTLNRRRLPTAAGNGKSTDLTEIASASKKCKLVFESALSSFDALQEVLRVLEERSEIRNHLFNAHVSHEPAISTKVLFDSFFGPHTHQTPGGLRFNESTGALFLSPHHPRHEIGRETRIAWVRANVLIPLFNTIAAFQNRSPSLNFATALLGKQFSS